MSSEATTLPLHPFLSSPTYMIDSFVVVGYPLTTLNEINLNEIQNEPPELSAEILSVVTNSKKLSSHFEFIPKYIFPSPPEFLNEKQIQKCKDKTKFIFFFQEFNSDITQHNINNKSGCYAGFVFQFYEYYTDINNKPFFTQKAFCVITRNLCFNFCNRLCELVYDKYRTGIESIPLEVIIYNIVHFTPAPHSCDISIDFESLFTLKNETSLSRSTISTSYSEDLNRRTMNCGSKLLVEQFTCYPQFHCSMTDILKIIPFKNLIEISLYMLFEFNVFYFSKQLDVLNNVMYIATYLNWPITDSILMGQIISINENDFELPGHPLVKPSHCIIGINAPFNNCLSSPHLENSEKFIVVDIDNKQVFNNVQLRLKGKIMEDSDIPINEDIKMITEFVTKLINKKKIGAPVFESIVQKLCMNLQEFTKKYNIKDTSSSHWNEMFNYDIGEEQKKLNLELQGIFFVSMLSFIKFFTQLYRTDISTDDTLNVIKNENVKLSKEEKLITSFFTNSMNAESYIKYFLQHRQNIDNYQVQFTFIDELAQFKHAFDSNSPLMKVFAFGRDCLSITDKLYIKKSQNTLNIDFSEFISFFNKEQFKDLFMRCLTDSDIYKKKLIRGETAFISEHIELDKNILFKYAYMLSNYNCLQKIFPYYDVIKSNIIEHIPPQLIENAVENAFINYPQTKNKDILLVIYLQLLACIAEKVDLTCQFNAIIALTSLYDFSFRKSFNILFTEYYNNALRKHTANFEITTDIEHIDKLLYLFTMNGHIPNAYFFYIYKQYTLLKSEVINKPELNKSVLLKKEKPSIDNKEIKFELSCDTVSVKKKDIKNYIIKTIEQPNAESELMMPSKYGKSEIWVEASISKCDTKINAKVCSPRKLYQLTQKFTFKYVVCGKKEVNADLEILVVLLLFYMHYNEELKKVTFEPFIKYLKTKSE